MGCAFKGGDKGPVCCLQKTSVLCGKITERKLRAHHCRDGALLGVWGRGAAAAC